MSKTAPTGEYLTTGSFMIRGNDLLVDYGDGLRTIANNIFKTDYSDFIYEISLFHI